MRARELVAQGILKRLWQVPGRRANYGLWSADDATALHAAISSLPYFPWLDVDVHPACRAPLRPALTANNRRAGIGLEGSVPAALSTSGSRH